MCILLCAIDRVRPALPKIASILTFLSSQVSCGSLYPLQVTTVGADNTLAVLGVFLTRLHCLDVLALCVCARARQRESKGVRVTLCGVCVLCSSPIYKGVMSHL